MTDPSSRYESLVSSMGVTACDASVFEALRAVANSETERVLATAHRIQMQLGQLPVGPEAVRLACETHMLMQPPVREVRREMRGGGWWAGTDLFAALLQSLLTLSSSSPADPLHSHRMRISLAAPRLLARQAPHSPRHARTRTPPPPTRLLPRCAQRLLEVARVHNSRGQAWPLGATVLVPAHHAALAACAVPGLVVEDFAAYASRDAAVGAGVASVTMAPAGGELAAGGGSAAGDTGEMAPREQGASISLALPDKRVVRGGGTQRAALSTAFEEG